MNVTLKQFNFHYFRVLCGLTACPYMFTKYVLANSYHTLHPHFYHCIGFLQSHTHFPSNPLFSTLQFETPIFYHICFLQHPNLYHNSFLSHLLSTTPTFYRNHFLPHPPSITAIFISALDHTHFLSYFQSTAFIFL
jgi:hypothetical protein